MEPTKFPEYILFRKLVKVIAIFLTNQHMKTVGTRVSFICRSLMMQKRVPIVDSAEELASLEAKV